MNTLPASACAAAPAPTTSARYEYVDTRDVIFRLGKEGWRVSSAVSAQPRKRDPLFAKHRITFLREREDDAQFNSHGAAPTLLFTNSHDGSSSASVRAGLYRFVCSNGLVIGQDVGRASVRHSGDAAADLIERARQLSRNTVQLGRRIDVWNTVQLSLPKRQEFARLAAQLRWGTAQLYAPAALLEARRAEDDHGTLWATFNRVQENAVRGGVQGLSGSGRAATSLPLSDITRDTDFNANLWRLADEVADFW